MDKKFNPVKYRNDYDKEHYDKMLLSFPKGTKEVIRAKAKEAGKSISQYVLDLVNAD